MGDNYVSRRDRIIASAIEIVSDFGLASLTTRNLAIKENMSEALMYKYFTGIDEVLVEVVEHYVKFDKGIRKTIKTKKSSYIEKLRTYLENYATYYDNYYAISTIMLQYEELLHNAGTRERIAWCITERLNFLEELFDGAINNKEIVDVLSPKELANNIMGITMSHILSRRIMNHKKSFKQEYMENIDNWITLLKQPV